MYSLLQGDLCSITALLFFDPREHLTRQALAREVGVNPQTIGFLERGDYTPSLELAFKISRFFKLPVEAVFSPDPFRPLSEQVYEMQKREA